ncbi:hypothetical protein LNP04_10350 [Chryseobacterium sp. C-71]|uniref:hypothetical protein n=1 Tax=Chryseobacterium sp. C-71 TaxID=2893882 RepID=UPI001E5959FE|nr:hypothetical protein [Chryseobacterium sp. C-71]UFH30383.1 hypothetical protein LNP04_10350 [Chryseobacterium sp. C-71]
MKKNLLFIFCFFSGLLFSQQAKKTGDIKVSGDYTHQFTKTIFPELWSGFQRKEVHSYDSKNRNVAVSYIQQKSKKEKTVLSLYIYPSRELDNHLLRDEFLSYEDALTQNSNTHIELKPSFGELANEKFKVSYIYSIFNNTLGEPDFFKGVKFTDKQSLLAIYECGGWRFKIRITSDDMTQAQLEELKQKAENYFEVLSISSVKAIPLNDEPNILLSPIVQRDSMMTNATIVAAKSKIDWLKKNLDVKEASTGFHDMKIESEIYAIEKMMEFYHLHKTDWKMTTDTEKYFNEMTKIVDNKKIEDHIYEKFNNVIIYPDGESRKDSYLQFKIDHDISENTNETFYKIFHKLD